MPGYTLALEERCLRDQVRILVLSARRLYFREGAYVGKRTLIIAVRRDLSMSLRVVLTDQDEGWISSYKEHRRRNRSSLIMLDPRVAAVKGTGGILVAFSPLESKAATIVTLKPVPG